MERSKSDSTIEIKKDFDNNISENAKALSREFLEYSEPRDGMSAESATLLIGECANNKELQLQEIENEGRYFRAKVLDRKGKVVNGLLIDKLNGNIKFIK
jgi:hypothetical protein